MNDPNASGTTAGPNAGAPAWRVRRAGSRATARRSALERGVEGTYDIWLCRGACTSIEADASLRGRLVLQGHPIELPGAADARIAFDTVGYLSERLDACFLATKDLGFRETYAFIPRAVMGGGLSQGIRLSPLP